MKRIAILCIYLMFFITTCSCSSEPTYQQDKSSEIRIMYGDLSPVENGAFHVGVVLSSENSQSRDVTYYESVLKYTDFSTMQSTVVCSKPNCLHNNSNSSCTAFGMDNHAVQVGKKLFFFEDVFEYDKDGNPTTYQNVWQAALDGGERVKLGKLDDVNLEIGSAAVVIGERIYFVGVKKGSYNYSHTSEDISSLTGDEFYFCRYDFSKKELTNFGLLGEGFSGGGGIDGRFNGKLYFGVSYMNELVDFQQFTDWQEYMENMPKTVYGFFCFDFETETLTPSDMPSIENIGIVTDDYYGVRTEDGELRAFNTSGEEKLYSGYDFDYINVLNGYVFNFYNGTALNLDTGEIVGLKQDMVGGYYKAVTYRDGRYIFYTKDPADALSGGFVSVDEKDIFVK